MTSYNGYILPIRSNCKEVTLNKTCNLLGPWRVRETFNKVRTHLEILDLFFKHWVIQPKSSLRALNQNLGDINTSDV